MNIHVLYIQACIAIVLGVTMNLTSMMKEGRAIDDDIQAEAGDPVSACSNLSRLFWRRKPDCGRRPGGVYSLMTKL